MKTPFLGCAYYPEDWDESEIPYDISKMKEAGITCARIGEFAWKKMEPREGEYDFVWLHKVVDALREAGIAVVMGTPTATPPHWLIRKHPDMPHLHEDGTRSSHGGRRHCCSNNPNYLAACDKIVTKLAEEFGSDPAIIGWQIDNEIYTGGEGCLCEHCMKNFHDRLREQYGTVEEVNRRWNLNLFSQAYDAIDDIPAPVRAWHNPHIHYEWSMAHFDADRRFIHRQNDILKKYTSVPVGTDMMPLNGLDYEEMTEKLDVVQFNHYNGPGNLHDCVFWFDFMRTLKDRPFWNTETQTTWNGSVSIGQHIKPEGYCRINSWLPVALGGEANMYWLWRQHWAGHELVHGSVLSPEGRPVHVFGEVQHTARDFEKASDIIGSTKVKTDIAVHFTSKSWNLFDHQSIVNGLNYSGETIEMHRVMRKAGFCPDVIGAKHTLDGYKLLFTPLQMTLENGDMAEKIRAWVENGGVWVAGPMTDIRDSIGAHYTKSAMGHLEDWLGITLDYSVPTNGTVIKAAWADGDELTMRRYTECYTIPETGDSLAKITSGHSALIGENVIAKIPFGKGTVILLGTLPDEAGMRKLIGYAAEAAGVKACTTSDNLVVSTREGENGENALIVGEIDCTEGKITLDEPMTDILTGETCVGETPVEAYGIRVFVKA